jgi:hypothetical protein
VIGLLPASALPDAAADMAAIATGTGGSVQSTGDTGTDVATAILTGLSSLSVTVTMDTMAVSPGNAMDYITTSFAPTSRIVTSGTTAAFTETISVAADTPGGTYELKDFARINGVPMTNAAGAIIYETKTIKVPEGFVTGGGQITKDTGGRKKESYKVTYGGNVGFLSDFSLVGQWQLVLHNVGVNSLDKAHFHSTMITSLQFYYDDSLPGPTPPPANANIAFFTANGTLNGETGWKIRCTLVDSGEPGVADAIAFSLWDPGDVMVYYQADEFDHDWVVFAPSLGTEVTTRAGGNIQIHPGLK